MKKYLKSRLMVVIMCVLLAGCGNSSRSSADDEISETEKSNPSVGSETQAEETDEERDFRNPTAAPMTQKGSSETAEKN